jgi:ABC-type xylose transport system substrate-binding protein
MRARATALFVALLCFVLVPLAISGGDQPVHIGLLLDSLKDERWQRDSKLIQARARELGVKITVKDAEGNDELQIQQANQLLEAGVNVLIGAPRFRKSSIRGASGSAQRGAGGQLRPADQK